MRSLVTLLFFVGLGGFGYHLYNQSVADAAFKEGMSENGFVQTGDVDASVKDVVLILRPDHCPSDEAQRADALDRELTRRGIPHTVGASMSISDDHPTEASVAAHNRAVAVFNQGAPAVYINGFGKSNPTADEVAAEFKRTHEGRKAS
jgi:hypothetical protein